MTTSDPFNAYHAWLGIPPEECDEGGPHYYQLLGLRVFEKDPQAIDAAARRTIATLSPYATGAHEGLAERLLLEVGTAAACLRDPTQKAQYDRALASGEPLVAAPALQQAYVPPLPAAGEPVGGLPTAAAVDYVQSLVQPTAQEAENLYALQPDAETVRPQGPLTATKTASSPPVRRIRGQGSNL